MLSTLKFFVVIAPFLLIIVIYKYWLKNYKESIEFGIASSIILILIAFVSLFINRYFSISPLKSGAIFSFYALFSGSLSALISWNSFLKRSNHRSVAYIAILIIICFICFQMSWRWSVDVTPKEKFTGRISFFLIFFIPSFVVTIIIAKISNYYENRFLDSDPNHKTTFYQLTEWYKNLENVKELKTYDKIFNSLNKFNDFFGDTCISKIEFSDLENYQMIRLEEGASKTSIDFELSSTRTMIKRAFNNDKAQGKTLKTFQNVQKLLQKNE